MIMTANDTTFETAVALRRSLSALNRRLRAARRDRELSAGKLSVLGHLHRDGPATPGALAQAEAVQPQSLTRLLAELEAADLVSRRQDLDDRRQFLMEITPAGRELVRRDALDKVVWLARAIETHLSPTEARLLRLAGELLDRLAVAPEAGPASPAADADRTAGSSIVAGLRGW
jgi:DNA-binding MarR family transcriptional regulator